MNFKHDFKQNNKFEGLNHSAISRKNVWYIFLKSISFEVTLLISDQMWPTVYTISGNVSHWSFIHWRGHSKCHRRRSSQLFKDENGKLPVCTRTFWENKSVHSFHSTTHKMLEWKFWTGSDILTQSGYTLKCKPSFVLSWSHKICDTFKIRRRKG